MSEWVQKCPFCGNCSGYLDDEVGELEKQLIASDRYQVTLNESSFPELARLFLALPLKHECKQKYSGAAREAIHAPWVCDDYERKMKARECRERERALHYIEKPNSNGQSMAKQVGVSETIKVDLLRRAGRWDEAIRYLDSISSKSIDSIISKVIIFEKELILSQDDACHSSSELFG